MCRPGATRYMSACALRSRAHASRFHSGRSLMNAPARHRSGRWAPPLEPSSAGRPGTCGWSAAAAGGARRRTSVWRSAVGVARIRRRCPSPIAFANRWACDWPGALGGPLSAASAATLKACAGPSLSARRHRFARWSGCGAALEMLAGNGSALAVTIIACRREPRRAAGLRLKQPRQGGGRSAREEPRHDRVLRGRVSRQTGRVSWFPIGPTRASHMATGVAHEARRARVSSASPVVVRPQS